MRLHHFYSLFQLSFIIVHSINIISCTSVKNTYNTGISPHEKFASALDYTPVFNSPDIKSIFGGKDNTTLKLDKCGNMRELEYIALPGTIFLVERVLEINSLKIYMVTTDEYPYTSQNGLYIDSRMVRTSSVEIKKKQRKLPSKKTILAKLQKAKGSRYVWGGNCSDGIPKLLSLYPPAPSVLKDKFITGMWMLRGLDCSGLLYQATGGYTPRNTSSLVNYGNPVKIAGLSAGQIAKKVQPLDLITWNGHVVIVLNKKTTIESHQICPGAGGVMIRPLTERLNEIFNERKSTDKPSPADSETFVIRRWYP